jgi:hypothetical protein
MDNHIYKGKIFSLEWKKKKKKKNNLIPIEKVRMFFPNHTVDREIELNY